MPSTSPSTALSRSASSKIMNGDLPPSSSESFLWVSAVAIRKATASSHKKLSPELGGKSPFIIFDDADLDSAVEGLVDGIWFNQGQVCCAGSRLLMQESIAETLIARIRNRMSTLRAGPPLDKSIDIGAIVSQVQLDRIKGLVDRGIA